MLLMGLLKYGDILFINVLYYFTSLTCYTWWILLYRSDLFLVKETCNIQENIPVLIGDFWAYCRLKNLSTYQLFHLPEGNIPLTLSVPSSRTCSRSLEN